MAHKIDFFVFLAMERYQNKTFMKQFVGLFVAVNNMCFAWRVHRQAFQIYSNRVDLSSNQIRARAALSDQNKCDDLAIWMAFKLLWSCFINEKL